MYLSMPEFSYYGNEILEVRFSLMMIAAENGGSIHVTTAVETIEVPRVILRALISYVT